MQNNNQLIGFMEEQLGRLSFTNFKHLLTH